MNMMNYSHNRVVFAPACLLCPSLQAGGLAKENSWRKGFIDLFSQLDLNIIQLPCPESSFGGYITGLSREKHGIKYYENLDGFVQHCNELSNNVIKMIAAMVSNHYEIVAILGIEHSPTCAANYMYTNQGTIKRKGIFLSMVHQGLQDRKICIPLIGINRRFPNKSIQGLKRLLD